MPNSPETSPAPSTAQSSLSYDPAGPALEAAHTPARGIFVGFIIFAMVASTLAMVSFIWYRWSGVREPTTAVIVQGDAALVGTVVTVSGQDRTISAPITSANSYSVPILVDPGIYTVRAELNGRMLLNKDVEVRRFFGVKFDLSNFLRQTGDLPATAPTASAQP